MGFTIDSPTLFEYTDTRRGSEAFESVEIETVAITRSIEEAIGNSKAAPEPTGYRITHVFQVADDDEGYGRFQYVETMDVETWEHVTPAIDVMMTRTRADGWTVGVTVAQLNLPRAAKD